MPQFVKDEDAAGDLRTEWDVQHANEPWWNDWVRLRSLIELNAIAEARELAQEVARKWPDVSTIRHYESVLEPPVARTIARSSQYDPQPDYAWLRAHAHEHPGAWLAVSGGRLIAADPDLNRVIQTADAQFDSSTVLLSRAPDRMQSL